jgi:hypothetical protein
MIHTTCRLVTTLRWLAPLFALAASPGCASKPPPTRTSNAVATKASMVTPSQVVCLVKLGASSLGSWQAGGASHPLRERLEQDQLEGSLRDLIARAQDGKDAFDLSDYDGDLGMLGALKAMSSARGTPPASPSDTDRKANSAAMMRATRLLQAKRKLYGAGAVFFDVVDRLALTPAGEAPSKGTGLASSLVQTFARLSSSSAEDLATQKVGEELRALMLGARSLDAMLPGHSGSDLRTAEQIIEAATERRKAELEACTKSLTGPPAAPSG